MMTARGVGERKRGAGELARTGRVGRTIFVSFEECSILSSFHLSVFIDIYIYIFIYLFTHIY